MLELQMTVMGYGRLFLMDMIPWSVLGGMASTTMINNTTTAKLQGLAAAISKPQASFSFFGKVVVDACRSKSDGAEEQNSQQTRQGNVSGQGHCSSGRGGVAEWFVEKLMWKLMKCSISADKLGLTSLSKGITKSIADREDHSSQW